ncbi:ATP-binding protein [Pelagicoccus albus]|uniref:histidine kinase n=1 Tax=Pelagicoccus albus TaxID=415222 RepID=A0A7X1B9Q5_9BACT|nr:ATP-binding protein [Pelagicoccus albus]MBC2608176.1 response regulator [Pelagicoccus albus]
MNWTPKKLLKPFLSLGVSKKILLATTVSSFITLSLFTVFEVYRVNSLFTEKKIEQIASIASILESYNEAPLGFGDPFAATDYLAQLDKEADITNAILYDTNSAVFAKYQREPSESTLPFPDFKGAKIGSDYILYAIEVELEGEMLGTLLVEADTSSIKKQLQQTITVAVLLLIAGTVIAFFIGLGIQKLITDPLKELETIAKKVYQDGDYTSRAVKRYSDEVGSLTDSFNFMMESVQTRDKEIQENNRDLELEVAARTIELRTAMEKAQAANKAKSEFLSTMSHELRTPMNAIVGMASLLMGKDLDEERQSYVKIIHSSSDTLLSLINDVLDYSKIESGNLDLEREPFGLLNCIEEAMDIVAAPRRDSAIEFMVTIDPKLPAVIEGDVTRLRQVLINLLGNAVKFTSEGHVWLEAKYCTPDEGVSKYVEIAVHDTGIGIPEDRKHRLFQTFSQVDSSMTRRFGGTGLGLAISQRLTKAMGGLIEVESKVGVGSTFRFSIPIITDESTPLSNYPSPNPNKIPFTVKLAIPSEHLKASVQEIFESWDATIVDDQQEADVAIIYTAHLSDPEEASVFVVEESNKLQPDSHKVLICHPRCRDSGNRFVGKTVFTAPIHISDLRSIVQNIVGQENEEVEKKNSKLGPVGAIKDAKILLAEDNKLNQKVFKLIMKREGYQIDIVNDGAEALAAILRKPYDLVFMDLQMPVMDGLEATRTIRSTGDKIAQPWIIGFTANVEADAAPAIRAAGMNDYLPKPVKDRDIRSALKKYIESRGT